MSSAQSVVGGLDSATGRKAFAEIRGRNKPLGRHRVGPVGEGWDSVEVHRVGEMKGRNSGDQLGACEDACILVKV